MLLMIDVSYQYDVSYTVDNGSGINTWEDVFTFEKLDGGYVGKGIFNRFDDGETMHIEAIEEDGFFEGEYRELSEMGTIGGRGIMSLVADSDDSGALIGKWYDKDGDGTISFVRRSYPVIGDIS